MLINVQTYFKNLTVETRQFFLKYGWSFSDIIHERVKAEITSEVLKTFLGSLFMDGVQLYQGYRATINRQFTFYQSFHRSQKDERLSQPWSHAMILNLRPLDWESSVITTSPFFSVKVSIFDEK